MLFPVVELSLIRLAVAVSVADMMVEVRVEEREVVEGRKGLERVEDSVVDVIFVLESRLCDGCCFD